MGFRDIGRLLRNGFVGDHVTEKGVDVQPSRTVGQSSAEWQPLERLISVLNASAGLPDETGEPPSRHQVLREALEPYVDVGLDDDALDAVAAAAEELRPLVALRDVDEAARALNSVFEQSAAQPRLTNHTGTTWHLHVDPPAFSWRTWFLASSGLALALLLSERGRIAWGLCEATNCGRAFLDQGRGGGRRYCSTACSTRSRVAAHRSRQRQ